MSEKKITKLENFYYLLEKNGQQIEVTEHELQAIKAGAMRVRWQASISEVIVTDIDKYRQFLRNHN